MAESKTSKSSKQSTVSYHGQLMDGVINRLKMHKSHKSINQHIQEMDDVLTGRNLQQQVMEGQGTVKKAYLLGAKYAEELVSDAAAQIGHQEPIIDILRRGWPDPSKVNSEKPDEKKEENLELERSLVENRARTTKFSPDVTV